MNPKFRPKAYFGPRILKSTCFRTSLAEWLEIGCVI